MVMNMTNLWTNVANMQLFSKGYITYFVNTDIVIQTDTGNTWTLMTLMTLMILMRQPWFYQSGKN